MLTFDDIQESTNQMNLKQELNELAKQGYSKADAIATLKHEKAVAIMNGMVSPDLAETVLADSDGDFADLYHDEIAEYQAFLTELEKEVI